MNESEGVSNDDVIVTSRNAVIGRHVASGSEGKYITKLTSLNENALDKMDWIHSKEWIKENSPGEHSECFLSEHCSGEFS